MILKSKTFQDYYGIYPDEYYIKFIHHNIIVSEDTPEEYQNIKEDFNTLYNFDTDAFVIYFSDLNNYQKILNHIKINELYSEKVYLRIRTTEEYEEFLKYNHLNNVKIIIDIKDIEKLDIKDLSLVIQIDKISELNEKQLNELQNKYQIKEILLGQIPYLTNDDLFLYDVMAKMYNIDASQRLELEKINKITNDLYSVEDYIKILHKFNEIISYLNIEDNIDGFYKIFDYIAKNVSYDDEGVTHTLVSNQNLVGPVFEGKSVCEGYSKYLQQLLSLINIDSIVVQGGGKKEDGGHVWNQVCINDKWYNADVTAASYNVHHGEEIKTYLVSDEELMYKTNSSISHVCDENYNNLLK